MEAGDGIIENTGDFVNRGQMEIMGATLANTEGSFTTYNTGGLSFSDGATINTPAEFHNAGYIKVTDGYGDTTTAVTFEDISGLTNDSSWIDYTAAVYSDVGLTAAISAQAGKISAPDSSLPEGIRAYQRLDFAANMTLTGEKTLENFANYWIVSYWNDETKEVMPVILTVAPGAELTVARGNTLFISGGALVNSGTVNLEAEEPDGESGANIEVWVDGAFTNNGTVENSGVIWAQDEYKSNGSGDLGASAVINGSIEVSGLLHTAKVYDWEGLNDAAAQIAGSGPAKYYARIEIRGENEIVLEDNLVIEASVFIEWDSGIEVPEGMFLNLAGAHQMHNNGDIWVFGTLNTGENYEFYNFGYVQAGSGSAGSAVFENGGAFHNRSKVEVWLGGSFNNTGYYDGDAPDDSNGGVVSGIAP